MKKNLYNRKYIISLGEKKIGLLINNIFELIIYITKNKLPIDV